MRSLFLTNNPNLSSTSRILQAWLLLGRGNGLQGRVVGQRRGDFVDWLAGEGIPHRVDPMPWPDRRRPWRSLWHAASVGLWARRAGVDLIHCNEHDVYPFASVLRQVVRRPMVCHVRFRLDRGFAEWAFGGTRRPDALLWTSHQQKADSADAVAGLVPEERQHVVRLGVDPRSFGKLAATREATRAQWGVRDDEILIGTASPLRPRKRVEDFVELMRRQAARHPNVVGVIAGGEIAGDEEYRRRIEREVADSGLGRRLQWVGNLEPVEPFHHACDVSVSTSEYETFGNSVCEAMSCGRPVAGYHGGSVAEVVGEAGLVVATGDVDALTSAVERLVTDAELRRSLGEAGRRRVAEEFSPAASLRQLEGIYREVLSRKVAVR